MVNGRGLAQTGAKQNKTAFCTPVDNDALKVRDIRHAAHGLLHHLVLVALPPRVHEHTPIPRPLIWGDHLSLPVPVTLQDAIGEVVLCVQRSVTVVVRLRGDRRAAGMAYDIRAEFKDVAVA